LAFSAQPETIAGFESSRCPFNKKRRRWSTGGAYFGLD
jgi:hypothetical protein